MPSQNGIKSIMTKIKYIGYFDTPNSVIKRYYPAAGAAKMTYIAKSIAENCGECEIVSMAPVIEENFRYYKSEYKQISSNVSLRLFSSFGGKRGILSKLRYYWHLLNLFVFLILKTKKGENVVVYHSLSYKKVIVWAKKIKGFKLILELNEIYTDVRDYQNSVISLEEQLIDSADKYIFATELLNDNYNKKGKPFIINYGTYEVEPHLEGKFDDGKIHVVYAGTFDPRKGGCLAAAAAAELPENYHVHILGFGTEEQIESIKKYIKRVNEISQSTLTYEGLLLGNEFTCFIQKCHIGLSTQDPNAKFNNSSFPSKMLMYMANGLNVVSINIPAIKKSQISRDMFFYQEQTSKSIAEAILKVEYKNSRETLYRLDAEFKKCLKQLF